MREFALNSPVRNTMYWRVLRWSAGCHSAVMIDIRSGNHSPLCGDDIPELQRRDEFLGPLRMAIEMGAPREHVLQLGRILSARLRREAAG